MEQELRDEITKQEQSIKAKESALEEFNLTYADKLTTEIEKIQQEFEKANASERENVDEQIDYFY